MDRRRFLSAAALLAAGCHTDRLLEPCPWGVEFLPYVPPSPGGELRPPSREIWAVNNFAGPQLGTKANPFQVARDGWDAFMRGLTQDPSTFGVNAPDSFFTTRACYEWGPLESPWRLPSGCYVDGHGSTLELDTNVPDTYVQSPPLHMICTAEGFSTWDGVPVGQAVRNWRFVANYSKLVDRWKALGANLLPSAVMLQGHAAAIENVELVDFGALGIEAFPLIIAGVMAGPDRHALSFLDPSRYLFDGLGLPRTHISGVKFTGHVPSLTTAQVSVAVICGMFGAQTIPTDHWEELPPYVQLMRTNKPYISDVECVQPGSARDNQIQLATIYQCDAGEIANIRGTNVQAMAYGDYYSTRNVHCHHLTGRGVLRGVAQFLSPTAANAQGVVEQFSCDGLKVTDSDIETVPIDVTYHGGVVVDPLNAAYAEQGGAPRQITNVTIDRCKLSSVKTIDVKGLVITENNQIGEIQTVRCPDAKLPSCGARR